MRCALILDPRKLYLRTIKMLAKTIRSRSKLKKNFLPHNTSITTQNQYIRLTESCKCRSDYTCKHLYHYIVYFDADRNNRMTNVKRQIHGLNHSKTIHYKTTISEYDKQTVVFEMLSNKRRHNKIT